jgi:hypothetical protein
VIETAKGEEMLPITEVPQSIASGMSNYRNVFCKDEGFEHVSRYVTGLIVSPNKTLQVWKEKSQVDVQCTNQSLSLVGIQIL